MAGQNSDNDSIDYGMLDHLIGYRLRRAQMNFFSNFASVCSDLGISPGLFAVLEIVQVNPGLTQTAVAQALGNDRSAMVSAVDRLEQMNLIERRPSKRDRRSYALYLTDHGEQFHQQLRERVRTHEDELSACLKPGERDWLLEVLALLAH